MLNRSWFTAKNGYFKLDQKKAAKAAFFLKKLKPYGLEPFSA